MTGVDDLIARIVALETRVAHQDSTIEELNTIVTKQWQRIDRLNRDIANLVDRLKEFGNRPDPLNPEPPPPHY